MKLSIVISTQPASFSALAYKGKVTENIAKIKEFGYDGVELAVRDPKLLDIDDLKSVLSNNNLPVSAIGTGQAYGEEALSFTNPDEEVRKKAIDRIKSHIQLAAELKAVVILGLIRGTRKNDVTDNLAEEWLIAAIQECASENKNVRLVIEPINRYETNLLNTVTAGMEFVNKVKMDNVGLLLDTFHMNIEEPNIFESIISAKERLFHFHVADSNRWYPGAGHIDFKKVIQMLSDINYQGYISGEILPMPDPDTAAQKTIDHLGPMIG